MSDDTAPVNDRSGGPTGPEAPAPPPQAPAAEAPQPLPAYAMPLPAGYPAYAVPPAPRPRFSDQVLGMRAVVAVALACLIIGGLSGWILGHAAARDGGWFGPGPGVQRSFPGQFPHGPNGR